MAKVWTIIVCTQCLINTDCKILFFRFTRQENFDRQNGVQYHQGTLSIDRLFLINFYTVTLIVSKFKKNRSAAEGKFRVLTLSPTGSTRKKREPRSRKLSTFEISYNRKDKVISVAALSANLFLRGKKIMIRQQQLRLLKKKLQWIQNELQ